MISLFPLSSRDSFQAVQMAINWDAKPPGCYYKSKQTAPVFVRHIESAFMAYEKKILNKKEHSQKSWFPGHPPPEVQVLNDYHTYFDYVNA